MNKYDTFFNSYYDFLISTQLSEKKWIIPATEKEILLFEEKHKVKFPISVISYLKMFGTSCRIKVAEQNAVSLEEIRLGIECNQKYNLEKYAINQNTESLIYFNIDNLHEDFILFMVSNEENPKIYIQWDLMNEEAYRENYGEENTPRRIDYCYKFVTMFRSNIFFLLLPFIYTTIFEPRYKINTNSIDWVKYYKHLLSKQESQGGIDVVKFKNIRMAFCLEIEQKEILNDKLYTVNEFEYAFIEYLMYKEPSVIRFEKS